MIGFEMLRQHVFAVTNRKITSLLLPRPNLCLGFPACILIQLVVGCHIGAVNHVEVANVQGPLFKDIKKLQAASSLVASRYTEIQAVPICLDQAFQSVKE